MPRGISPRRPAKTGRHEGARAVPRARLVPSPAGGRDLRPVQPGRSLLGKTTATVTRSKYNPVAQERVSEILKRLDQLYPGVTCALTHRNAWELLVATILSAQSTDVRVNMVTPEIFKKYPTVQDFAALKPEQLEPDIRSTGFFRNKSKSVVGAAKKIVSDFGGEVSGDMDQLLTLPGVARKTANVVLGTWFGKNEGLVVDTHVQRLATLLGLTKEKDPVKIERDLMALVPRDKRTLFSHTLILHRRRACLARRAQCDGG